MKPLPKTPRRAKPWYRSKTLWLNGLAILAGAFAVLAGADLDPTLLKFSVLVSGVLNVILRVVTTEGIK